MSGNCEKEWATSETRRKTSGCGYNFTVKAKLKILFLACLVGVSSAFLLPVDSYGRVRESPYYPYFYNPFPPYYNKNLVKVFDGMEPGTTTLEEILERYGYPKYIVNNRYFYYELNDWHDPLPDRHNIYVEFRRSRKFGKQRFEGNLPLTAVVSKIFVFSDYRMGTLATYLNQILGVTPYPYELYYVTRDDYYTLLFRYQGYAMYFDGDSGRLIGEAYFEPELYEVRSYLRFSIGGMEFRLIERDKLPVYLR